MLRNGTILVPLDGSPISERSLPYATALASALDGKLVFMIAAYISEIPSHGPWSEEMVAHPRETCMAYLEDVRKRAGAPAADLIAKVGYPHEMITEAAKETRASCIVVSTHGRSGITRWMYGSTVGSLLHTSHVPVLAIGKNVPPPKNSFHPRHVMVPLDASKLAEAALPYASEIADAFSARATLVRVAPFSVEAYPMMVPQMYWPELDKELVASAQAYLERVRAEGGKSMELQVLQGPRADTLLTFAEENAVDLVVMSTHGRAGVQRAMLGSTADRMLEGPAPVLLVRPD
jgi:nucleotide-binding universal stress UspA family protein